MSTSNGNNGTENMRLPLYKAEKMKLSSCEINVKSKEVIFKSTMLYTYN